jgi:hypothetical protein
LLWLNQNEQITPTAADYLQAATIKAAAREQGSIVELPDCLIAAVAVRLGLPLVTGNTPKIFGRSSEPAWLFISRTGATRNAACAKRAIHDVTLAVRASSSAGVIKRWQPGRTEKPSVDDHRWRRPLCGLEPASSASLFHVAVEHHKKLSHPLRVRRPRWSRDKQTICNGFVHG